MRFIGPTLIDSFRAGSRGLLTAAMLGLVAASASAVEVVQGQVYAGGTRLEAPELGAAFTVPPGWRGTWPAGTEVFVLQPEADPNVVILATGQQGTRAELEAVMAAPIDLGNGISLLPASEVGHRTGALTARYKVHGQGLDAYAEGLAGSHGIAVAYVLIASPSSLAAHEAVVQALTASTDLRAPNAASPPAAPSGQADGVPSGSDNRWDTYLKRKYIVRYYTATGYTDEQHLWLCSDGTFSRRGAAGGFGGGASGAFQADSTGRWTATGAGEHGTLTLSYGDGSTARHELRWDYSENKLYVDGKRWLHDKNEVCR